MSSPTALTPASVRELLAATADAMNRIGVMRQAIGEFADPNTGLLAIAVGELRATVAAAKAGVAAQIDAAQALVAELRDVTAAASAAVAAALAEVGVTDGAPVADDPTAVPAPTIDPAPAPPPAKPGPGPGDVIAIGRQRKDAEEVVAAAANGPVAAPGDVESGTALAMVDPDEGDDQGDDQGDEDAPGAHPAMLTGEDRLLYVCAEIARDPHRPYREIHTILKADGIRIGNRELMRLINEARKTAGGDE